MVQKLGLKLWHEFGPRVWPSACMQIGVSNTKSNFDLKNKKNDKLIGFGTSVEQKSIVRGSQGLLRRSLGATCERPRTHVMLELFEVSMVLMI